MTYIIEMPPSLQSSGPRLRTPGRPGQAPRNAWHCTHTAPCHALQWRSARLGHIFDRRRPKSIIHITRPGEGGGAATHDARVCNPLGQPIEKPKTKDTDNHNNNNTSDSNKLICVCHPSPYCYSTLYVQPVPLVSELNSFCVKLNTYYHYHYWQILSFRFLCKPRDLEAARRSARMAICVSNRRLPSLAALRALRGGGGGGGGGPARLEEESLCVPSCRVSITRSFGQRGL